jgi:hypothetical protein
MLKSRMDQSANPCTRSWFCARVAVSFQSGAVSACTRIQAPDGWPSNASFSSSSSTCLQSPLQQQYQGFQLQIFLSPNKLVHGLPTPEIVIAKNRHRLTYRVEGTEMFLLGPSKLIILSYHLLCRIGQILSFSRTHQTQVCHHLQ